MPERRHVRQTTEDEILALILGFAEADDRIRVVVMNGSRVNPSARRDPFQDFDIATFVTDVEPFRDEVYVVPRFGEAIVVEQLLDGNRIVVAVEIPGPNRKRVGRIRMSQISDFSGSSLVRFVVDNVTPGSKVITDGWRGYWPLGRAGVIHKAVTGDNVMIHAHHTISLLKRWLLGTHQGRATGKHLQHYLEEFTFRHNRRKSNDVGMIFFRMLQGAVDTKAPP